MMYNNYMFDHDAVNFKVEKVAVKHDYIRPTGLGGENEVPKNIGVLIRRKDTKKPLALVKDSYTIQQYNDIVYDVEKAIRASGMDLTDSEYSTNVYEDGAQLELTAKFPAEEMRISGKDKVIPEFKFRTSHNGTWASSGMMGLWRSMCYNTLVSGDKLAYVYGRHTKGFSLPSFTAQIKNAGEYIKGNGASKMRDWYDTALPREDAIHLFSKTLAKRTDNVSKKNKPNQVILSHLIKIFDLENQHLHGRGAYEKYGTREVGSLWTAYQAATHWSTHVPTKNQNSRVRREERVRKMLQSGLWLDAELNDNLVKERVDA